MNDVKLSLRLCVCDGNEQLWPEAFSDWTWAWEGWWQGQSSEQCWGKVGIPSHHWSLINDLSQTDLEAAVHLFFKQTCIFAYACVRVRIHTRVLESSEHSGSQLRPSQQPSVAQLNPPPPPPTLCWVPEGLMCTAEGHVLGTRARRQAKAAAAPLHLYHLCYSSLSSPSTMVWSGPSCLSSFSSTLSSLSAQLFPSFLGPLSTKCTEPSADWNLIV